jgi:uncharacterized protein involved in exopolysaccharide biosynthesis
MERALTFRDFQAILRRRSGLFVSIAGALLTIGIGIAFGLPPVYQSQGLILVEQQEVPEHLVRSTVTGYADERLRMITQRVMTRDILVSLIDKYGLYPDLTDAGLDERVSEMRDDILVDTVQSDMLLREISRAETTIAFTVSFSYRDPALARDLANELVQLYLNENKRVREELAAETTAFLGRQATALAEEIAVKEAQLAEFKRKHAGALPELSDLNLQLLDRTERDVEATEREIRTLREKVSLLESELAQLSPYSVVFDQAGDPVLSAADRLKVAQRQYLQLSAIYSPDHPDVVKVRKEMDGLSAQTGMPALSRSTLQAELDARRTELAATRERYSPDHPDVLRLERSVAGLEAELRAAPTTSATRAPAVPPDNPVYIQKQVQLQGAQIELRAAVAKSRDLTEKMSQFEDRLMRTPEVEREFRDLNRGYEELVAEYANIQAKQREAQLALSLESQAMGERFMLLEPPLLPRFPASPNRVAVLFLSFVLAFAGGIAVLAIVESSDTLVRGSRDVVEFIGAPPLAVVPFIANTRDLRSRSLRRKAVIAGFIIWFAVIGFLILRPGANVIA